MYSHYSDITRLSLAGKADLRVPGRRLQPTNGGLALYPLLPVGSILVVCQPGQHVLCGSGEGLQPGPPGVL